MSPQDIKDIAIKNFRRVYGQDAVLTQDTDNLFTRIAEDVIDAAANHSNPYINPYGRASGSATYQTPLPTDLIFQEEKTTTEFMPPEQQLWMDIAVAAAATHDYDKEEWPSMVANATLASFNKRFPKTAEG